MSVPHRFALVFARDREDRLASTVRNFVVESMLRGQSVPDAFGYIRRHPPSPHAHRPWDVEVYTLSHPLRTDPTSPLTAEPIGHATFNTWRELLHREENAPALLNQLYALGADQCEDPRYRVIFVHDDGDFESMQLLTGIATLVTVPRPPAEVTILFSEVQEQRARYR